MATQSKGFEIFAVGEEQPTKSKKLIFKSASDFSQFIESIAAKENITSTQALIEFCDSRDIEFEDIAPLLSETFRQKILYEMADAGYTQKQNEVTFE